MIGRWFSRNESEKDLPEFWRVYTAKFEEKISQDISQLNFVVLDTETTGFNFESDRILSIGAVCVKDNLINRNKKLPDFREFNNNL